MVADMSQLHDSESRRVYLADYRPLDYVIGHTHLRFELHPSATRVTAVLQIAPQFNAGERPDLVFDGEQLRLHTLKVNGHWVDWEADEHITVDATTLRWAYQDWMAQPFEMAFDTEINPEANTALEGLYLTNGIYCTQCEAEGFRRITYYFDRPDNLCPFDVTVVADERLHQWHRQQWLDGDDTVRLLSNGNVLERKLDEATGRISAIWQDPHPKPCYLFALVAGDLFLHEAPFMTQSGAHVQLQLYVEHDNAHKTDHALKAMGKALAWDERVYGLAYDLDAYMIVAVNDFNMGAMENKGLNVFNAKFVLADSSTATDVDYEGIEAVIAHEYFHNWTGNRVTCRDWFQITLKEGLTVYRDQCFTADTLSAALKRIDDVTLLRANQFVEDAGPLSHPIQPQSYVEMNNFYTLTVYEKGAEVVRLYATLLGDQGFQKGMALYFERHDGQAVTVDDFRQAMADANEIDLTQMRQWYLQAGTPSVTVHLPSGMVIDQGPYIIETEQTSPAGDDAPPLWIPLKVKAYVAIDGQHRPLTTDDIDCQEQDDSWAWLETGEMLLHCRQTSQRFALQINEALIGHTLWFSWMRDFSAPIHFQIQQSQADNQRLWLWQLAQDDNGFVKWEAAQQLKRLALVQLVQQMEQEDEWSLDDAMWAALDDVMTQGQNNQLDLGLWAELMRWPDVMTFLNELSQVPGVSFEHWPMDAAMMAIRTAKALVAQRYGHQWHQLAIGLQDFEADYTFTADAVAARRLQALALNYGLLNEQLGLSESLPMLVFASEQATKASNMTLCQNATTALIRSMPASSHVQHAAYEATLERVMVAFEQRWHGDALVMDKYFALMAQQPQDETLSGIQWLLQRPDFSWTTPNRVRSVLGAFSRLNPASFHHINGAGYRCLFDGVRRLNGLNPQIAARLVQVFAMWRQLDPVRREHIQTGLLQLRCQDDLSDDVAEIVDKLLTKSLTHGEHSD